jgi:hypothetical protein
MKSLTLRYKNGLWLQERIPILEAPMKIKAKIFILLFLAGVAATIFVPTAPAQPITVSASSGRINENYSYEGLEVKRGSYESRKYGGRVYSCSFIGRIISTAHTERHNVTFRFTAFNNFREKLWDTSVRIKSLPSFGTQEFSQKITCQERDPFYWEIEVIEEDSPTR